MENAHYATNDDTAGFINQCYDLNFASIGKIRKHNNYDLLAYKAMVFENDQLSQILRKKMH